MSESKVVNVNFTLFGDIKQRYLPFVINPEAISRSLNDSTAGNKIQLFSFKGKKPDVDSMQLNIVPESYKKIFNEDIANQLLYPRKYWHGNRNITFDNILEYMPTIEIREFLPDTKLEQFLDFFGKILDVLMDKITGSKDKNNATNSKDGDKKEGGFEFSKAFSIDGIVNAGKAVDNYIRNVINMCFNYLSPGQNELDTTDNLFFKNGVNRFNTPKMMMFADDFNMYYTPDDKKLERVLMHDFPKLMYYKLQSITNSNVYVIPNNLSDKLIYSSNGHNGWEGAGISISQEVKNIPVIGSILGSIFNKTLGIFDNLRISYMPYWKSEKGQDAHPDIKIEFELINDTVESAIANFIFVNTIVPNNKIIQYGLFQHSSCLYDVKIGGYDRLFACSGKFEVKHKGILRVPSPLFFKKLIKHINDTIVSDTEFIEGIISNDLIRIPDTYEVSMEFKSLLPASFNNYMYTYSTNTSILDNIKSLTNQVENPALQLLTTAIAEDMPRIITLELNENNGGDQQSQSGENSSGTSSGTSETAQNESKPGSIVDQIDITAAGE